MEASNNDSIIILPDVIKKKKRTNFAKCLVCQEDSDTPLRKPKEASVQTLIAALAIRDDDVYARLKPDLPGLSMQEVVWHANCYTTCTSTQNLRCIEKRKSTASPLPSESSEPTLSSDRRPRSTSPAVDWSTCMFCGNKSRKKSIDMYKVCTFEACGTILAAAKSLKDEDMLLKLRDVQEDLMTAQAQYHKACRTEYISRATAKQKWGQENCGTESPFKEAFSELVNLIEDNINSGKAYDMTSLLSVYKDALVRRGIEAESYTRQKLKLRLEKHFGNSIVFHQSNDMSKPELVYSSTVSLQDVINAAFMKSSHPLDTMDTSTPRTTVSPRLDRTTLIHRTAKLVQQEIMECQGVQTVPLDMNCLTLSASKAMIPESLYCLLRWIVGREDREAELTTTSCSNEADERHILMIAQDIIHSASHGNRNMLVLP
jgi:hypothetical protein